MFGYNCSTTQVRLCAMVLRHVCVRLRTPRTRANPCEPGRKNAVQDFWSSDPQYLSFFGHTKFDFSAVEIWHEPARTRVRPLCGVIVLIPTKGPIQGSWASKTRIAEFRGGFVRVRGFVDSRILWGSGGCNYYISHGGGQSSLFLEF